LTIADGCSITVSMYAAPFPQLQAFLAVARHRSFAGAARDLGVTRSAVSQAARQLFVEAAKELAVRNWKSG
jgi:DNA-binding transcriptional LysR family regulator